MQKIRFGFKKNGFMKYISHLDLMRLFARGMRRAGLPIKMTEGFSPHPKLSIKRALKLGVESDNEEAAIVFKDYFDINEFKNIFQAQLPEGIEITYVQRDFN